MSGDLSLVNVRESNYFIAVRAASRSETGRLASVTWWDILLLYSSIYICIIFILFPPVKPRFCFNWRSEFSQQCSFKILILNESSNHRRITFGFKFNLFAIQRIDSGSKLLYTVEECKIQGRGTFCEERGNLHVIKYQFGCEHVKMNHEFFRICELSKLETEIASPYVQTKRDLMRCTR